MSGRIVLLWAIALLALGAVAEYAIAAMMHVDKIPVP